MLFLIDGYNLLFAVGYASKRTPQPQLDPSRRRLLDFLADSAPVKANAARFRVVFDAMYGPFPSGPHSHRGVTVEFAFRSTADDAIEDLLAADPTPAKLVVVTNDLRLHESARRARAKAWPVAEFLDYLDTFTEKARPAHERAAPEKPTGPVSDAEAAEWLRAFGSPG